MAKHAKPRIFKPSEIIRRPEPPLEGDEAPAKAPRMVDLARGRGQPRKIDPEAEETWRLLGFLGGMQCTIEEVAGAFGVHADTVQSFFRDFPQAREVFNLGKQQGRASLRVSQFKLARTNAALAIWLGKQHLGQKDFPMTGEPAGATDPNDARSKLQRKLSDHFEAGSSPAASGDRRLN